MKTLCLFIPTHNREKSIEYYLQTQADNFRRNNIDIIIYDSSNNELTKDVVMSFQKKGYSNLVYKYCDNKDDNYGSWKTFYGLIECAEKYDYIWLSGDTTIIQILNIVEQVRSQMDENCDVIHIYASKEVKQSQSFEDCREIFRLFWWSMTHWCSTVFSAQMICGMAEFLKDNLEKKNGFFIVSAALKYMALNTTKFYYIKDKLFEISPYRTASVCHDRKDILKSWAKWQSEAIDMLPEKYDVYKKITKKSISRNIHLFTFTGVLRLRADGNITYEKVNKYKEYIKDVATAPLVWFYICARIPQGFAKVIIECGEAIFNHDIRVAKKLLNKEGK